jgi:mannose/fructose/N-acetylgalactosamine-specific phosphotransferase system component IIB
MKVIVVDFVGIVDSSLAIGGIAIGDYSNGPEKVVVVAVVVVDDIDVNAGEELELLEETVSIGSEHFLSISELELTMAEVVEKSVGKNNF